MEQLEAKSVSSHVSVGWGIQHWMNLADSAQGRGGLTGSPAWGHRCWLGLLSVGGWFSQRANSWAHDLVLVLAGSSVLPPAGSSPGAQGLITGSFQRLMGNIG